MPVNLLVLPSRPVTFGDAFGAAVKLVEAVHGLGVVLLQFSKTELCQQTDAVAAELFSGH